MALAPLTPDALAAGAGAAEPEATNVGRTVRRSAIQPRAAEPNPQPDGMDSHPSTRTEPSVDPQVAATLFPRGIPTPEASQPPSGAGAAAQPSVDTRVPATLGRRFAAYLIDSVVIGLTWLGIQIVGFFLVLLASRVDPSLGDAVGLIVLLAALAAVLWVAVSMFVAVGRIGQTPGKRALGLRIIDADNGGPIGTGRAVVRQVVLVLMILPCYLGLVSFFMDDTGRLRAFHDKAANDVVVTTAPVPFIQAVKDVLTILRRPA